jgi:sister chromatid cohesion protein DCC1
MDALPMDAVVDAMTGDGFAPEMARNTLGAFATKRDDADDAWALDEEVVCRALVTRVLRDGIGLKAWPLADVMDRWREKLREFNLGHVEAKEEYLEGLALLERPAGATDAFVRTLIASDLPTEPADRFAALWAVKPRWTLRELDPYLKGQARPGQNIEAQLLKFCRVTQGDPPTYSKR